MASQKQIDANRKNAQKSTGPRTDEGKSRTRLNAIRDNVTGQITTLNPEDREAFESFQAGMLAELKPQGFLEQNLVHAITWDNWRLNRIRAIEMNIFAQGAEQHENGLDQAQADTETFREESKRLERMSLYEQRLNRGIQRNLTTLRGLQSERERKYEQDRKEEILLARLHEFNAMEIKTPSRPSKNGYVFSNDEIAVAAVRQRRLETMDALLKNRTPEQKYGSMYLGMGDQYLPHAPGDTMEAQAIHRQQHPEDYNLRPAA